MQFDFYDYMALAMALVMCLTIILAVHLYDKDAPRYIRVPIMLLTPVFFFLSIYCSYNRPENVRRHAVYELEESSMARDFKEHDTHVIRMISYSCGLVYFTDGITCVRWPKVEIVKRAENVCWKR